MASAAKSLITGLLVLAILAPSCLAQTQPGAYAITDLIKYFGECRVPQVNNILYSGQGLRTFEFLISSNKLFGLIMRCDCNLVLYDLTKIISGASFPPKELWSSETVDGGSDCVTSLLSDGRLIINKDGGRADSLVKEVIASRGEGFYVLELEDDGTLKSYLENNESDLTYIYQPE